jgi:DNA-binding CsgD family transcriptional regulator
MQYIFIFLLISSLSVGIVTNVLAFAVFFRNKSTLEKLFLAFLTFFTLRMLSDTVMFYVVPLLSSSTVLLYFSLLTGRITMAGTTIFITLFMHKLTDIFQSRKSRLVVYSLSAGLFLFFVVHFILIHAYEPPTMVDLDAFSPVDFLFFILPLYPIAIFFIFSRRIKNVTVYKMIRIFIIMILLTFPILIVEDVLGSFSIIFDFARDNQVPLRLFPVMYLMIYLFLLYAGFKNVVLERKLMHAPHRISENFISHFGITAREKEVIVLMIEGAGNKKIGEKLFISAATVRNHIHNIFEKTNAVNRVELIRIATS